MSQMTCGSERLPKSAREAACKCCSAFDADLLTENRSRSEFETIPAARHS